MEIEVRQLEARFSTTLGLLIALVTLIVAAGAAFLAVSVKNSEGFDLPAINTGDVALIIAVVALVASLTALWVHWKLKLRTNSEESERSKG